MAALPPDKSNGNSTREPARGDLQLRRLLTRAEAITLLGMILCILSLFLAWPVPLIAKVPVPAIVINMTRTGAAMNDVRWPITIGAILSGFLLAVAPSQASRMPVAAVQVLCGLACFVIAFVHFANQPGPIVDLIGGALLTLGAVDRLGQAVPQTR